MSIRKIVFLFAATICAALPLQAQAAALTITNNTNFDSTSIINNGPCSTKLGPSGTTHAHSTNVVPDSIVKMACQRSPSNCTAVVYLNGSCTAPAVYIVVLDVNAGIKSAEPIDPASNQYVISYSGFTATLSPK